MELFSSLTTFPTFLAIDLTNHMNLITEQRQAVVAALEDVLATTKTGLRVVLLSDRVISDVLEVVINKLENRGIRVVKEKMEFDFFGAVERMEQIMAAENRAAEKKTDYL